MDCEEKQTELSLAGSETGGGRNIKCLRETTSRKLARALALTFSVSQSWIERHTECCEARSCVIFERDELLICFGWQGLRGMTSRVTDGSKQSVDQAMPGLASLRGNRSPLCWLEKFTVSHPCA
jgi:hypothetical protein